MKKKEALETPIVDETEVIAIEPPSEIPSEEKAIDVLSRIGLTQVTDGLFQEVGIVEVPDVAQWMTDNGFVQDGGCYRKPGMIANVL